MCSLNNPLQYNKTKCNNTLLYSYVITITLYVIVYVVKIHSLLRQPAVGQIFLNIVIQLIAWLTVGIAYQST